LFWLRPCAFCGNLGDDSFRSGWRKCLGNGLLAPAASAATATTAASSAPALGISPRAGGLPGLNGAVWFFRTGLHVGFRFGRGRQLRLVVMTRARARPRARLKVLRIGIAG
jgi:hypothetical protein